ncbi:hypothetical protein B4U80_09835 [Leptotrombidium deliense]|uniref:Uncharacterized protein n=1 Tax=Leptotrombidium deliense TaxID=299467 RepID=A0A443SP20_9ACAR|nr:hypothetical protein B4U80_09835 [Leptotrombidium deliense]
MVKDKLSPKQSVTKLNSCNELDRGSTVLCMFTFDCMRANGKPIGVCMDLAVDFRLFRPLNQRLEKPVLNKQFRQTRPLSQQ